MHSYHTEHVFFHANGDPLPGDVLINEGFRTTSEEIVLFCAAVQTSAVGRDLTLRTTRFEIDGPNVTLRALVPRFEFDILNIVVPMTDLQSFATLVMQRRFEYFVADCFDGANTPGMMAAVGLIVMLMRGTD